jgi:hypothetical protein
MQSSKQRKLVTKYMNTINVFITFGNANFVDLFLTAAQLLSVLLNAYLTQWLLLPLVTLLIVFPNCFRKMLRMILNLGHDHPLLYLSVYHLQFTYITSSFPISICHFLIFTVFNLPFPSSAFHSYFLRTTDVFHYKN